MPRFLLSLFLLTTAAFGQSKPNIIVFLVDDLGYGDLGCFWQDQRLSSKKFDTPALDRMAAEGAKLTHHYVSASVCAPSRASLLQGRHQGHSDVRNSQFDKALPDTHSIASVLKTAGYRTIHIGKGGLSGAESSVSLAGTGSQNLPAHPLHRGFDRFFGYLFHADGHEHYPRNGTTDKVSHIYDDYQQITNASPDLYTTDAWTAFAKKEIIAEATDGDDQPFFLYLSYDTPHSKMQRPAVAYPPLNQDGNPLTGGIQWTTATDASGNVRYASTAVGTPPRFPHPAVDPYGYDHPDIPSDWATSEKQHVGMIRRIDQSIADILQTLKDLGIDDNTLCVFTSDNGPHNEGNNPRTFESFANLEGIKRDMWEGGIRVPTIVRWPGKIAGATGNENNIHAIGAPSAQWDWMPTFCEMAGLPAPAWCDGVSLLPSLTGTGTQRDKGYLYFEFLNSGSTPGWSEFPNHGGETQGQMQAIRIGKHMGVRTGITTGDENFRIYDVTIDPGQGTNLAASLPAMQAKMKALAVTARRPGGGVTRPYDNLPLPAETPSPTAPGLEWKSYIDASASWQWVPEFRDQSATASGTTGVPGVSVRPADDHFGLLFTGYIQIPSAGNYQLHLASDTGADFFLHDSHLIADDFSHTGSSSSPAVPLSAGLHPIRLYYRHRTGTRTLSLEWSGPGITRQAVPSSAFFHQAEPTPGPPTANDDRATTSVDASVLIDVLANDFDDGTPSPLAIQSVGTPTSGTAAIESGKIRYTPPAGFSGNAIFTYTITDGESTSSATVTVTVEIPLAPSRLVSYLPLDNASGITLSNGATITAGIQGRFGEALSLDGVNDFAVVNSSPGVSGNAQRTVSAWVYQNPGSSNLRTAVALGVNGTGTKWDLDIDNPNGGIEVGVGGGRNAGSGLNGLTGQWMLVSSTLPAAGGNVGTVKTYLNGVVTSAGTGGTAVNTAQQAFYHLGVSANLNIQFFEGRIDDVSIWDAALTADEIKCLFDVGNSADLQYTAASFNQLKQLHDTGVGSVTLGEVQWTYATGLTGPAGLSSGPSGHMLVLHAAADTGLTASPSFDAWMNGFNWSGFTNPDLTLGGDPDGDGISNGVENYFGTAPNRVSRGLVVVGKNGNQFTFTHPLHANPAGGLNPRYRWSADLVNFHDNASPNGAGTITVTFADPVPAGDVVSVTATISGSVVPSRLFIRVEVTQNGSDAASHTPPSVDR
jgi:arylsulfatase A-like enzyme